MNFACFRATAAVFAIALPAFGFPMIASAAVPSLLLPASDGERIHYRLARTVQGSSGPVATTLAFDLVRKGATIVLDRAAPNGGLPNLSLLKANADGSLALAEDPRAAALDGDLTDAMTGLNLALGATRNSDAAAHGTWYAALDVGSGTSIPVVIVPANVAGSDFDFAGSGAGALGPPAPAAHEEEPSGGMSGGGHGGMGGGGFPGGGGGGGGGFPGGGGGGFPGGGGGAGSPGGGHHAHGGESQPGESSGRNAAITMNVHVDGHSRAGRISRISITETRAITIAGLPYTNASSWQISAVNESSRRQMGTGTTP